MATKKEIPYKPVLLPIDIRWLPRYSSTMEDDEIGRWARVAYAGQFHKHFIKGKPVRWEIAWVKKVENTTKFVVIYMFPCTGGHLFNSLEEAQSEVEVMFKWFIRNVCAGRMTLRKK